MPLPWHSHGHTSMWRHVKLGQLQFKYVLHWQSNKPAIAQLVEHLTVETCSNQMVPGSIPGGRTCPLLYHELEARGVRLHISWGAWVALGPWLPWPARRPPPPLPFPKLRSSCSPQRGPRAATWQFGEGEGGRGEELRATECCMGGFLVSVVGLVGSGCWGMWNHRS